jgi:protein-L-isoaspartate(D-aspartate) O-methyltransferase
LNDDARKIRLVLELRRQGISDTEVLSAIERVPRELFVPEAFLDQAYENVALPIGAGQTISQPLVVAAMTGALEVGPRMKVLEVGTGSGYQAAVLAHLCRRLYTIERHRALAVEAEARLRRLRLANIVVQVGDGAVGWPEQAPFDRIIGTAASADVPAALADQLGEGGVMVLPLMAADHGQEVVRVRREANGFSQQSLMAARFVPLVDGMPDQAKSA